jgi:hypothetical protein
MLGRGGFFFVLLKTFVPPAVVTFSPSCCSLAHQELEGAKRQPEFGLYLIYIVRKFPPTGLSASVARARMWCVVFVYLMFFLLSTLLRTLFSLFSIIHHIHLTP